MRRIDEESRVILKTTPSMRVEGLVRRTGFEAMMGRRGVRYEARRPSAIVVNREGRGEQRVAVPPDEPSRFAMFAAPVAAFMLTRFLIRLNRRRQ